MTRLPLAFHPWDIRTFEIGGMMTLHKARDTCELPYSDDVVTPLCLVPGYSSLKIFR